MFRIVLALVCLSPGGAVVAGEFSSADEGPMASGADRRRDEAAPGGDSGGGDAARVLERLHEARGLLERQQTGEETRAAQRKVIDGLDRLIEAARAASSKPSGGDDASGRSGGQQAAPDRSEASDGREAGDAASSDGRPEGAGERDREGKAEESSDRSEAGVPGDPVHRFRSELALETWGHLPARMRERIMNAGAEDRLPEYDGLMQRYFESLAGAGADGSD